VPDNTFKVTNMETSFPNILMAMQGRVPGVQIMQGSPDMSVIIRGGAGAGMGATSSLPLFVLDGIPLPLEGGLAIIQSIPTTEVNYVDVLKSPANTSAYGSRGANGVIAVYTKRGEGIPPKPTLGIHNFSYPGFTRAREFYSPNYSAPPQHPGAPDIRTTLYWNPSVQVDKNGKAKVSFYMSDALSDYDVVVEGISTDGYTGVGKAEITVSE
jgi:TonB-dependent SusC/RagA subfamily outer membrane receptor